MIAIFALNVVRQFLLEAKFLAAAVLVTLLFGLSSLIAVGQHRQAVETARHDAIRVRQASDLDRIVLAKSPHPLDFVAGGWWNLPRLLALSPQGVETVTEEDVESSFLLGVGDVDWVYIVAALLSLLALFVSYDAVSREREDGTLRLILAQSVPRSTFLVGSGLGLLLLLLAPLALGFLVSLALIQISGAYEITPQEVVLLALVGLLAALYLALFVGLGMLVSSLCRYSATALLWLIFFWVVFIVILPSNGGVLASLFATPPERLDEVRKVAQIESNYQAPIGDYYGQVRRIVESGASDAVVRASLDQLRDRLVVEQAAKIQERDRLIAAVHAEFARRRAHQLALSRWTTMASPAVLFREAVERLITGGQEDHRHFLALAESYQRSVAEPIARAQKRHLAEAKPRVSWVTSYGGFTMTGVPEWSFAGIAPDGDLIPPFVYRRPPWTAGLVAGAWGILAMSAVCAALWISSLWAFLRYDVR